MRLIVDLHIHSKFSRATSKDLDLEHLYQWSKLKGINVLGTGDFTHPAWFKELKTKLEVVEVGLYQLKEKISETIDQQIPVTCRNQLVRFIPTVEISNIYKRHGQTRRLHNVIVAPDLETVAKINVKLDKIGNLHADGRPILGMDSEDLLKLVLETNEKCMFIPAHIWTPWFAMFGSKSGFDSVEEAFGENRKYIYAVETGLSADPQMCRKIGNLSGITLVSNSDAHSHRKLGREANILDCNLSYEGIRQAIMYGNEGFIGTIEFYPEEGKYHLDGHATCNVRLTPKETKAIDSICPVCNRLLTVGVEHRVDDLAIIHPSDNRVEKLVKSIVPLPEILAEIFKSKSVQTKKVESEYFRVLGTFGPEFEILLNTSLNEIQQAGFDHLAVALEKMRNGDIYIEPGYDGIYGTVKIFKNEYELKEISQKGSAQVGLFD